jgi:hypothetical protein
MSYSDAAWERALTVQEAILKRLARALSVRLSELFEGESVGRCLTYRVIAPQSGRVREGQLSDEASRTS